jgi:hypothetical protein
MMYGIVDEHWGLSNKDVSSFVDPNIFLGLGPFLVPNVQAQVDHDFKLIVNWTFHDLSLHIQKNLLSSSQ